MYMSGRHGDAVAASAAAVHEVAASAAAMMVVRLGQRHVHAKVASCECVRLQCVLRRKRGCEAWSGIWCRCVSERR